MLLFLASLLASGQPAADPLVDAWAACAGRHALAQLEAPNPGTSAAIVDAALAACGAEEARLRQDFIREFGPRAGADAFARLRRLSRERMILRVDQGRALRGV